MKKPLIILLLFHITITSMVLALLIAFPASGRVENNVVKIIKKAEIVFNFENELKTESKNPQEIIFTGFFIDKNTILTVAHGVDNKNSHYEITDKFGNIYNGVLVEKNLKNDMAILKINSDFEFFKKFKYAKNININDEVYNISFNKEQQIRKNGIIKKIENGKIFSSILFQEGDSGGPLFNRRNEIVGINIEVDLKNGIGISFLLK